MLNANARGIIGINGLYAIIVLFLELIMLGAKCTGNILNEFAQRLNIVVCIITAAKYATSDKIR
jgi:hypothetical protein